MGNEYAGGVHIVAAVKDGRTELWAAATPEAKALEAVQAMLAAGWKAERITGQRLTLVKADALRLRVNGVRKLEGGI
jgi:hypothetical protein